MKIKANECKKLTDYIPWLFYCSIHSVNFDNFSQGWENQTWKFQFCSSFFLLLLSPSCISQKLYGVCKYYTHWMTALLLGILIPFLVWSCIWATNGKLHTCTRDCLQRHITFSSDTSGQGFSSRILGTARIVRAHPDYWTCCITGYDKFASNQLWASRSSSSTIVLFIYLVLKTTQCNGRRRLHLATFRISAVW